ncbi:MAG: PAS domain-containing protein, partial [Pseudohongiellaceae bacterium]
MRRHDWSTSPLGHPDGWTHPLRSLVALILQSTFPMFVAWGNEHNMLYNDAYAALMQDRHPSGMGRPFREVWGDIWDDCLPFIHRAYAGQSTYLENLPLTLLRNGGKDQAYFTFSYSPAREENGAVAGFFCTCTETTSHVLAEQNQGLLLQFADQFRELEDPGEAMAASAAFLGEHLGLKRVSYLEVDGHDLVRLCANWPTGQSPRLPGEPQPLETCLGADSIETARAGRPFVPKEMARPAGIAGSGYGDTGIDGSRVVIPQVKGDRLTALLELIPTGETSLGQSKIIFAADVAERTWTVA